MNSRVAIVYSENYQVNMDGFENLHLHPQRYEEIYSELQREGLLRPADVFVPNPLTREQILTVHTEEFLKSLGLPAMVAQYVELPVLSTVSAELIDTALLNAFRWASGGTLEAGRLALKYGIAINIAGGYHHAKPNAGEGFCIYNDLAIAIRSLQNAGLVRSVLVVDLDVHQGNGTVLCFEGNDEVFTFSMHEQDIYPIPKERSDLDVALAGGTGDAEYLELLLEHLPNVIAKSQPQIVFFQAGADVLKGDPLANLQVTDQGLVQRDAIVIDQCARQGIPVVMTLGGGYRSDVWEVQFASIRRTIETYGLQSAADKIH